MDNNNPQPAAPVVPTVPVPPTAEKSEGNKMVLWFVIGLIVIIALVGGIYFFLSKQQVVPQPKMVTQTPSPTPQENLENDLNNVNVDTATSSSDFTTIDQDLQQL